MLLQDAHAIAIRGRGHRIGGKARPLDCRGQRRMCDCAVALFGCRRIAAVERVHHRRDPGRDEHLRRIGRPRGHAVDLFRFVGLEPREHVIGQIPPRLPSALPRPTPTRSRGNSSPRCAMTDFKPLCPPADPRARARSLPSGSCTSSTTISRSADVDLEVPRQLADRLPAEIHERQRLDQQHRRRRPAAATSRSARRPAPTRTPIAARRASSSTTANPTLCRVPRYFAPGLPSPTIAFTHLHRRPVTSSSRPSSCRPSFVLLVLVLLALLDDFGLGGVAVGAAAASAGAATSSAFGMITWTSIMSGSLTGFHFGVGRDVAHADALVQHQLADVDVDVLGNVAPAALDLDLAADELEDAALLLDALRLALDDHRDGHLQQLGPSRCDRSRRAAPGA